MFMISKIKHLHVTSSIIVIVSLEALPEATHSIYNIKYSETKIIAHYRTNKPKLKNYDKVTPPPKITTAN